MSFGRRQRGGGCWLRTALGCGRRPCPASLSFCTLSPAPHLPCPLPPPLLLAEPAQPAEAQAGRRRHGGRHQRRTGAVRPGGCWEEAIARSVLAQVMQGVLKGQPCHHIVHAGMRSIRHTVHPHHLPPRPFHSVRLSAGAPEDQHAEARSLAAGGRRQRRQLLQRGAPAPRTRCASSPCCCCCRS